MSRDALIRLLRASGAVLCISGAAFAQDTSHRLGFIMPYPETMRLYVAPDGAAPGLAITSGTCQKSFLDLSGTRQTIEVWSTLTTPLVPPPARVHGWSISARADGSTILSADSMFAGKAEFERTEVTTGAGNEGIVSTVLLSAGFPGSTAVSGGAFPIASMRIEVTAPQDGCEEATLRYEDGLRDSRGTIIRNEVLSPDQEGVDLQTCSTSICGSPTGREICNNGRDDDGDLKIDLRDEDCAAFPEPGDCVFFDCGCHPPFELLFLPAGRLPRPVPATARLTENEVVLGATNAFSLQGFEVSGRTRSGNGGFTFELTGDVEDGTGAIVRNVFVDGSGNRIPPDVANVLLAPSGQIESVKRGPDLEPFDATSFMTFDIESGITESSFWVRYVADVPSSRAVIPRNMGLPDCRPHRILTIELGPRFHRGDANGDGKLNISDPVAILMHLFGGRPLACVEAGNADDDLGVVVTDAVFLLEHLFRGGPAPPEPGPPGSPCGLDRTWSSRWVPCHVYEGC